MLLCDVGFVVKGWDDEGFNGVWMVEEGSEVCGEDLREEEVIIVEK